MQVAFLTLFFQGLEAELVFDEHLNPLGIRIQSRLRILICTHCQVALLPKSVRRHISDHHKHLQSLANEQSILTVSKVWDLLHEMPKIESPAIFFQGLPLFPDCVKCLHCTRVFAKSTLPSHHSTVHSGVPTPHFDKLVPIYAQRLNNGQNKSLFEVIVPSVAGPPISQNIVVQHLRISRDNLVPQYFPDTVDPRSLSSWMKYTGWYAYTQPRSSSLLVALVAMPQANETGFAHIKSAVSAIFDTGYQCITKTNLIVLQKLKTNDVNGLCVLFTHLMNNAS